jgi:hypothetical protein
MVMMIFVVAGVNVSSNQLPGQSATPPERKGAITTMGVGHPRQGEAVLQQTVEHHSENFIFSIGLIYPSLP